MSVLVQIDGPVAAMTLNDPGAGQLALIHGREITGTAARR